MVAKHTNAVVELLIIENNHSTFTGGDGLIAKEAKGSSVTEAAYWAAFVEGTDGFGTVFNNEQTEFFCQRHQWIHIAWVPIEMNGHDGLGFVCNQSACGLD